MKVKSLNGNFAGAGLGNIYNAQKHIVAADITNPVHITALIAFHVGFKDSGLLKKFANGVGRLYFGGTERANGINFLNPGRGAAFNEATFFGTGGSHVGGWSPNGTSWALGNRPLKVTDDIRHFSAFAWFKTAEEQNQTTPEVINTNRFALGGYATGSNNYKIGVQGNGQGTERVWASSYTASVSAYTGGGTSKTGLKGVTRIGNIVKEYTQGGIPSPATNATKTDTSVTTFDGQKELFEGGTDPNPDNITKAKLGLLLYQFGADVTDADVVILHQLCTDFFAAVG